MASPVLVEAVLSFLIINITFFKADSSGHKKNLFEPQTSCLFTRSHNCAFP